MMTRFLLAVAALQLVAGGCVRRTASFTTIPEGARVLLNDLEVGRTPVTVDFLWYGDYDVVYRLEDHESVHTHVTIEAPWYQRFPMELFAEVLWPRELHDHHDIAVQELTPLQLPDRDALIDRAMQFRDQALLGAADAEAIVQ